MKKCHNLNIFHCQGNLYFQGEMVHTDVIVYHSICSSNRHVFTEIFLLLFSYSERGRMSMLGLGDIVRMLVFVL